MTEAEFLPLFDQYRPMVYGLALSYTRSPQDAEDVCQEVFLTLLEKPPAPGKERPWLARVAVNRCRDLLTSPWRRRRENDDTALERLTFETPEEAGLFAALGALSPDSRALLHLRYYEGFTVAELARRCVIQGKADGSFGYADPLQRCDGAVLLMRVLEQVDNSCRGESQTVTLHILNADTGEAPHKNLFRVGFVSALAMALHNFPEGVATFLAGYEDLTLGVSITLAIALHNIPEGISVAMPVWYATGSRRRAFRCTLLSGLTEPVGAVLAFALLRPFLNGLLLGVLFGAVAGIMVYIAVEELIPSSRQYGHDRPALWATLCGICVMPLTHLFQT